MQPLFQQDLSIIWSESPILLTILLKFTASYLARLRQHQGNQFSPCFREEFLTSFTYLRHSCPLYSKLLYYPTPWGGINCLHLWQHLKSHDLSDWAILIAIESFYNLFWKPWKDFRSKLGSVSWVDKLILVPWLIVFLAIFSRMAVPHLLLLLACEKICTTFSFPPKFLFASHVSKKIATSNWEIE